MLDGILTGLSPAASPLNILMVAVGCFAGTFIGMLPGLGPISAIALMIPITYGFDDCRQYSCSTWNTTDLAPPVV